MATDDRYERQIRLFGAEGQSRIGSAAVAIVGLGGLGSHVAQQLAYLGVTDYTLIDHDVATATNLNRLIAATDADVEDSESKVSIAERLITTILPDARVDIVPERLEAEPSRTALATADVVFGCLDEDVPRLLLTDLCARNSLTYIDLATDVTRDGAYGGRVVFSKDGNGCPYCLGEIDQHALARAQMTEEQRAADDKIYGIDRAALGDTGPSVVSLNGVVASLGVTEFMVWITSLREPKRMLVYRADEGGVRIGQDEPTPNCYYCKSLWGKG